MTSIMLDRRLFNLKACRSDPFSVDASERPSDPPSVAESFVLIFTTAAMGAMPVAPLPLPGVS
jgi:hypothetical protein